MYRKVIIQQTTVLVVKKVIAVVTEVAGVLLSPLVIYSHLCCSKYFTNITFPYMWLQLK